MAVDRDRLEKTYLMTVLIIWCVRYPSAYQLLSVRLVCTFSGIAFQCVRGRG